MITPLDWLLIDIDLEQAIEDTHFRRYLNSVLGVGSRAQEIEAQRLKRLYAARSDEMMARIERENIKDEKKPLVVSGLNFKTRGNI
jgi:hypothetical protein